MRQASLTLMLLLVFAATAQTQGPEERKQPVVPPEVRAPETPLAPTGDRLPVESAVHVGEPAPDFELNGSRGEAVGLADFRGYWAVLVFQPRRADLAPLKQIDRELHSLGARQYGVCRDAPGALKTYARREGLPFTLLSDYTGQVSQLYGMYDIGDEVIRPGLVILDRRGVVRAVVHGQPLRAQEVLQVLKDVVIGT